MRHAALRLHSTPDSGMSRRRPCSRRSRSAARRAGPSVCSIFGKPALSKFGGFAERHDTRDVLSPGAALPLVHAAVEERRKPDVAPDEENAGALWRIHLVAGEAEEIDVLEDTFGLRSSGSLLAAWTASV